MFHSYFRFNFFSELIEALWALHILHTKLDTAHNDIAANRLVKHNGHIRLINFHKATNVKHLPPETKSEKFKKDYIQFAEIFVRTPGYSELLIDGLYDEKLEPFLSEVKNLKDDKFVESKLNMHF